MADYQEYRRRILRKRWRRNFAVAGLLVLLILLSAVGLLWKRLHREQSPAAVQGPTIFQQELQSSEWNTISYTPARRLTVQTTSAGSTAMDFRLAALDRTTAVDRSYFANVCFLGDSLTQGMQIYSSGLPEASFCAYRGANPSVVVNGTTCKRSDGGTEVPMEVLTARQPPVLYILLGTNVLNRDGDYSSFLTYYRLMLDMISQDLPHRRKGKIAGVGQQHRVDCRREVAELVRPCRQEEQRRRAQGRKSGEEGAAALKAGGQTKAEGRPAQHQRHGCPAEAGGKKARKGIVKAQITCQAQGM